VQVVDVWPLASRGAEYASGDARHPVEPVPSVADRDDTDAPDRLARRFSRDERDVVTRFPQASTLPAQDPGVLDAVNRGQMADLRPTVS